MSSQPPSTLPPVGISKSAAKKRAKKAAAAKAQDIPQPPSDHAHPNPVATALAEIQVDLGQSGHPHPTDPSLYHPPGSYPVDFQYEQFFDEGDLPLPNSQFSLPFLDYNLPPFQQNGNPFAGLSTSVSITNEDLIQTANELYRRMADPKFASDDTYWASLPPHLRQFIREAVPFSPTEAQANGSGGRDESIHSLAQRIVSVASQGMGLGQGMGASMLANGRPFPQPGLGEELGFHRHPDAREEEEFEDDDFDPDEPELATANGDVPKKKNKKKKKKAAVVEPPPAPLPPPAIKQPPPPQQQTHHQPLNQHPQQHPNPAPRPALNPPPPPAAPAPNQPPPSSRAAGKQPMSNSNAPANAPQRSARAAGKAPAAAAPPHNHNHPHAPAKTAAKGKAPANQPPAKIWSQSSAQDRENIRSFWLGLSEAERRDLLQIEKDAVLRKMKEQHRHSCGCAVCGRKKVNIEMELDQLYEQYYDELRSYAAEQRAAANGRPGPPGAGPFPGSVEVDPSGAVTKFDHRAPDRSPPEEYADEDSEGYEDEEEEYDDEEELEEDIGSDEADVGDEVDDPPPLPRQARKPPTTKPVAPRPEGADDFMAFGSSLASIKGGILTVADDLLKNDGAKFLEMMEQLAVARSVREEQNIRDIQADTEDEEYEEEEPVTEAERMEEGKRMFQIFAARLFEQRVLQAYREKVAKQREEQLLRELEEEEDSKRAKEEKKAKEAQKKKDKKKLQKQRADEEKAAREAAVAAEQAAARLKAEEAERERQKKVEEERIRREAVKKASMEEAAKREVERKKRQQEEKEREEEARRKRIEQQDKARKEKEAREREAKERERKEREDRLAKEKVEKERLEKEKAEKAERDRLAKEKAEKERLAKLEEEKERARKEEAARKEREAAEQAKILAAQQAHRERLAARQKAEAEQLAAEAAAAARLDAARIPLRPTAQPIPTRAIPRNGPTTPPLAQPQPTPVKASASSSSRASSRPPPGPSQKTPQPYFPQPLPAGVSYTARLPSVPQTLAPGFRPVYPSQSPVFSPPATTNGGISPNAPRPYPEPQSYDAMRAAPAPIGMGFPNAKPRAMEEYTPPSAPIGSRATSAGDLNDRLGSLSLLHDHHPRAPPTSAPAPAPIGPPGPIGRPAFLEQPNALAVGSSALRTSPARPDKVLGSAALGSDDEIVQPASTRRSASNGWELPTPVAPNATVSRWSASPSIWGSAPPQSDSSPWGAPTLGAGMGPSSVPGLQPNPNASRKPSFGFGGLGGGANLHGFQQNLFSPPSGTTPGQQHH